MKSVIILLISLLIILLILLTTITIKLYHYYKKYEYYKNDKYIKISKIYDELKSGDIILFKSNAIFYINVFLTNGYYTHIGIVVKKNNILYISEINSYGNIYLPPNYKTSNHSELFPLLIRIKYFAGDCYLVELNKNLDKKRENILLNYSDEKILYPTPFQRFINYFTKNISVRHCFQYVGYILDKMGITNNIMSNNIINICSTVENIFTKKLNDEYQYNSPIRIIYDI